MHPSDVPAILAEIERIDPGCDFFVDMSWGECVAIVIRKTVPGEYKDRASDQTGSTDPMSSTLINPDRPAAAAEIACLPLLLDQLTVGATKYWLPTAEPISLPAAGPAWNYPGYLLSSRHRERRRVTRRAESRRNLPGSRRNLPGA